MKLKQKLCLTAASLSLILSQTGCITGILIWPLWIPGAILYFNGSSMVDDGILFDRPGEIEEGRHQMFIGTILDEKNPGRVDVLNPIPRDEEVAQKANVSVDDISDFNDSLNQIQPVAQELISDIRSQVAKVKDFTSLTQLESDAEINKLAQKYGFGTTHEFIETFKSQTLPAKYLQSFAQNTKLSTAQAKLLLYYGFGVKSEK